MKSRYTFILLDEEMKAHWGMVGYGKLVLNAEGVVTNKKAIEFPMPTRPISVYGVQIFTLSGRSLRVCRFQSGPKHLQFADFLVMGPGQVQITLDAHDEWLGPEGETKHA